MNWAVWSSIIHGARGIDYFDHSFSGPQVSDMNVEETYFQTVQPGQSISIYAQIKATDAAIKQLAPVINSPNALGYVQISPAASQYSGVEAMAKYYNKQFYIFAETRDSMTMTNIAATFTLADKAATNVTVVNENRTISVSNGVFKDTFASAATVHIYQINGP